MCVAAFPDVRAPFEERHSHTADRASLQGPLPPRRFIHLAMNPDLEALLRVGDQTPDPRFREFARVFSFHGLLIPLQGSSTSATSEELTCTRSCLQAVVMRSQPSLRERASLQHRPKTALASTLRWIPFFVELVPTASCAGASKNVCPTGAVECPDCRSSWGHPVTFMGFLT